MISLAKGIVQRRCLIVWEHITCSELSQNTISDPGFSDNSTMKIPCRGAGSFFPKETLDRIWDYLKVYNGRELHAFAIAHNCIFWQDTGSMTVFKPMIFVELARKKIGLGAHLPASFRSKTFIVFTANSPSYCAYPSNTVKQINLYI